MADESTTVRSADDNTTEQAPRSCGLAPSGASGTHLPVKQKFSLFGDDEDAEEQVFEQEQVREKVSASKESWCRVESMPRESWLRRRRKHWPDQSRSTVLSGCHKIEDKPRCDWIVHRKYDERRHHFPGRSKPATQYVV